MSSNPSEGNLAIQATSDPIWTHDYDPSWSPLNTQLVFDRSDSVIIRKPLPWLPGNEVAVTASNNPGCDIQHGDDIPAVSPDGQWVAFSRCNGLPTGGWSLWKVRISGGAATQLTPTVARTDFYASWSPDGQTIYFQRQQGAPDAEWTAWKVPADGSDTARRVFTPQSSPDKFDIVQPASSPDGSILTAGYGKRDFFVRRVVTHTLDPAIPSPDAFKLVANYPDTTFAAKGDFPVLSPRLSPDGTRLALGSKQVWAARRNMNKPPVFSTVAGAAIADTTPVYGVNAIAGSSLSVQVNASDPESNALTYDASFLESGMSFDPGTRTLGWPLVSGAGHHYVKFRVSDTSGGTDVVILDILVLLPNPRAAAIGPFDEVGSLQNPTHGDLEWGTPFIPGAVAQARIFDVAGRRVALIRGPAGSPLRWDGRDASGGEAPDGMYLYVLSIGGRTEIRGRFVLLR